MLLVKEMESVVKDEGARTWKDGMKDIKVLLPDVTTNQRWWRRENNEHVYKQKL